MDVHPDARITPRQTAEALRRVAALAFRRRLTADPCHLDFLDHAARIYEMAAFLIEDAADEDDVRRVLETLRLHEVGAGAYLLRWLHFTVSDFIDATLLGNEVGSGGIPPTGPKP